MLPTSPPAAGIDALWPLCLAIAARRRAGSGPPADTRDALGWDAVHGFALRGVWDADAVELFELLKPLLDRSRTGRPWTIGQLGQSLDGCVATHGGDSAYVNGPEILVHLHRLRALSDAIIVGPGTAALDDPQLTTRRVSGPHPVRVLLDPALRLPAGLRAFNDHQAPTLLACDARQASEARQKVGADQVLAIPGWIDAEGVPQLRRLQDALEARGLRMLFVEGGGITVSRFIAQGCLDRLHLSVAPVIIGDGRPGLQLPRSIAMRDCLRPAGRIFRMGADVLWDLDLRSAASVA
jgi:riboflavin-specific deaminase-like protein